MPKRSAGLIMFRRRQAGIEVLLVHPGGPFWAKKDLGAWSIPKGEYLEPEAPLDAAQREFREETSFTASGPFFDLGTVRQSAGKLVSAWAFEGDCDPDLIVSNTTSMEWPPRSGRQIEFPEVDRANWFPIDEAESYLLAGQVPFLSALLEQVDREQRREIT